MLLYNVLHKKAMFVTTSTMEGVVTGKFFNNNNKANIRTIQLLRWLPIFGSSMNIRILYVLHARPISFYIFSFLFSSFTMNFCSVTHTYTHARTHTHTVNRSEWTALEDWYDITYPDSDGIPKTCSGEATPVGRTW